MYHDPCPQKIIIFNLKNTKVPFDPTFLGVEVILITKLEVRALKLKIKLFGKSYFFYFKKCLSFFFFIIIGLKDV
jgi:hypothetical protein